MSAGVCVSGKRGGCQKRYTKENDQNLPSGRRTSSRTALFPPHAEINVAHLTRESEIFIEIKIDMTNC